MCVCACVCVLRWHSQRQRCLMTINLSLRAGVGKLFDGRVTSPVYELSKGLIF